MYDSILDIHAVAQECRRLGVPAVRRTIDGAPCAVFDGYAQPIAFGADGTLRNHAAGVWSDPDFLPDWTDAAPTRFALECIAWAARKRAERGATLTTEGERRHGHCRTESVR